jgi:hypothetical protein
MESIVIGVAGDRYWVRVKVVQGKAGVRDGIIPYERGNMKVIPPHTLLFILV